jgi:MoxR-like ATPase
MIADGHILLEDFPGLGKTILSKSIASALQLVFKRIQFTPDLLPGDITGGYYFDREDNQFKLRTGPIFANIILADEINRASPKTQSALLEAMQEYQVSIDGETLGLTQPFIVIATQNPIEYEGTFPLPEAQLDRFMVKLSVGYPDYDSEIEIIDRRKRRKSEQYDVQHMLDRMAFLELQQVVEAIYVTEDIEKYIVDLVSRTRNDSRISVGSSPRGSLALFKLARVNAAFNGRKFVIPDDVKQFIKPALSHRLLLEPEFWMKRRAVDMILDEIIESTPVPVLRG